MTGSLIVNKAIPWLWWGSLALLPVFYGLSFWHWQGELVSEVGASVKVEAKPVKTNKAVDSASLVALFGAVAAAPAVESVKESGLSLKLLASLVSPGGRSGAVLAGGERKQQLFFAGDEVLPGVQLVRVQARRVLIKRNGVLESISLTGEGKANPVQAAAIAEAVQPEAAKALVSAPEVPAVRPDLLEKLNKLKSLAGGDS